METNTWIAEKVGLCEKATDGKWYEGRIEERDNEAVMVKCPPSDSGLTEWPLCEIYGNNFGASTMGDVKFIADARTSLPVALLGWKKCLEVIEELVDIIDEGFLMDNVRPDSFTCQPARMLLNISIEDLEKEINKGEVK